jgi:hydroxymethylbilane synthase
MSSLRIGTRGSQLALYQARTVAALLFERAGVNSEIVVIKTSGDRLAEAALSEVGGKRLFVKEIEDALLAGDVDVAVHSSKDMPVMLPDGLTIAAVLPREDARDALVLPAGPESRTRPAVIRRIGTSSVRRIAQLSQVYPDAEFVPIRGNLDTRLRKLDAGEYDALVLAAAGLRRLDRGDRISSFIAIYDCVPAPGQGIIAIETRAADAYTRELVGRVNDERAGLALRAERTVIEKLGGGCQMPIGAHADITGDALIMSAIVTSLDGQQSARAAVTGPPSDPEGAGTAAAAELLERGAGEILAAVQRAHAAVDGLQP